MSKQRKQDALTGDKHAEWDSPPKVWFSKGKASDSKKETTANYYKIEEHIVETFSEAETLATSLYAPFTDGANTSGPGVERTCKAAKVRIRRRAGNDNQTDIFRVILYKRIPTAKKSTPEATEKDTAAIANRDTKKFTKSERQTEVKSKRRQSKVTSG